MEAASIASRVKDARAFLLRAGRSAGGRPAYGWMLARNPDGPGRVVVQDPERVQYVTMAVSMALNGETTYRIARWLDGSGAPLRHHRTRSRSWWSESSVEALLRNPVLAGLTAYQPGRRPGERHDPTAVLRNADGLPVVNEEVAIISTEERRRLLDMLDSRKGMRRTPDTQSLLSQMLTCGTCGHYLHKARAGNDKHGNARLTYACRYRSCADKAGGGRDLLDDYIADIFLTRYGAMNVVELAEETHDNSESLRAVERAIRDTTEAMGLRGADRPL